MKSIAGFFLCLILACNSPENLGGDSAPVSSITATYCDTLQSKLDPFYEPVPLPKPGDWISSHNEKHQSYRDYIKTKITRPDSTRKVIYVQPLGIFDSTYFKILKEATNYLHHFFGLEVKILLSLSDSLIPARERRMNLGKEQLRSLFILNNILKPRLPKDAMLYIAFTTFDLYPSEKWSFVFGQASLSNRVGVWSLNRFGDPDKSVASYELCLMRTLKTAAHESSHIFSIPHCRKLKCLMNGANGLEEADSRPQWLCPECLCKLSLNLRETPSSHLERMRSFWALKDTSKSDFYGKCMKRIAD